MAVLSRTALEASPLADLHAIASELGIDGFRRLRKAELVDAILERGGGGDDDGEEQLAEEVVDEAAEEPAARPARPPQPAPDARDDRGGDRAARGGAGRGGRADRRGRRGAARQRLGVRPRLAAPSRPIEDVYVSAAQVRRCELVSGDRVSGPVRRPAPLGALSVARPRRRRSTARRPRRSPRARRSTSCRARCRPSASSSATGTRRSTRIDALAPIGRGSRVVIAGARARGQDRGAAAPRRRARRPRRRSR
jgi:transcription termination factor Rho